MFSAHRVRAAAFAALGAALGLHATACGNDQRHAPFASATCRMGPCSAGAILGGSVPSGGEVDSGTSEDSGSGAQPIVCHTDTNLLVKLCTGSAACPPDVRVDPVRFRDCGFRGAGVDVECVCGGTTLCPVAVQTDCNYVKTQLSLKTSDDICAPAFTGGCNMNSLGAGGSLNNGAGGGP